MATSPMQLDQPPMQPPDVTAQQGGNPAQDIGNKMAGQAQQQRGGQPGGGANPQGALLARAQAIKAVLEEMAKMQPAFAPFANRIQQLLTTGLGQTLSSGQNASAQPRNLTGSAAAPEAGAQNNVPG